MFEKWNFSWKRKGVQKSWKSPKLGGGKFNKKVAVIPFDTLIAKEVFVACLQKILPELQQNDIGTNGE